jgi:hypothetical protein
MRMVLLSSGHFAFVFDIGYDGGEQVLPRSFHRRGNFTSSVK